MGGKKKTQLQQKQYIKVGSIAMRDTITGEFGKAVPLYIETEKDSENVDKIASAFMNSKPFQKFLNSKDNAS